MCLLCYALDDRDSLRGLRLWRNEFLSYADVKADRFPFIVVGNKVSSWAAFKCWRVFQFRIIHRTTCGRRSDK